MFLLGVEGVCLQTPHKSEVHADQACTSYRKEIPCAVKQLALHVTSAGDVEIEFTGAGL